MLFQTILVKNLKCTNILLRLCSSKKPHGGESEPTKDAETTEALGDARDPHCNPYSEEPLDITIESYKDSKKYKKRIFKKVLIEKELDASARSRLTKECKQFISSTPKHLKSSIGCSLAFNQSGWQTYDFDKFQIQTSDTELKLKDCPSGKPPPSFVTPMDNDKGTPAKEKDGDAKKSGEGGEDPQLPTNRLIRQEPGKVIATFIPMEFLEFFFSKTGVSGFYTFLFTFGTYLVSKEIYVLDHNYYHGLGALFMWIGYIKYMGPPLARYLDNEIDKYEQQWKEVREAHQKGLEDEIVHELLYQFQADGQLILIEAKRENVALQLEEEYRIREMKMYEEVKRILDYHVQVEVVKKRFQQKNLVEYVTKEVSKAITPDLQNRLIYYSIESILAEFEKREKEKK